MRITIKSLRSTIKAVLNEGRYFGKVNGTISFPTTSAIALWKEEILGQMSDGAWENTTPDDHWKYWSDLKVKLGSPGLDADMRPLKTGYNLAGLIEYIGDRMVAIGKMGKALGANASEQELSAAENMPKTYDMWKMGKHNGHKISEDQAKKFYDTDYTMKDLRKDLSYIKLAMKGGGQATQVDKSQFTKSFPSLGPEQNYYELSDGRSHKFWSYAVVGNQLTVNYGRIGSSGTTNTKVFSTPAEAEFEAKKLVRSKLDKGYKSASKGATQPETRSARSSRNKQSQSPRESAIAKLSTILTPEEMKALGL